MAWASTPWRGLACSTICGQKACLAVELEEFFAKEAKKRQATSTGGRTPQLKATLPEAAKGQARDQAAAVVGVGGRTVSKAKAVKKASPDFTQANAFGLLTRSCRAIAIIPALTL